MDFYHGICSLLYHKNNHHWHVLRTSQGNFVTQQIYTKGSFPRFPVENGYKLLAPTWAQFVSHRKPCFASGALERLREAFHRNLEVCTLTGRWMLCLQGRQLSGVWEEELMASQNTGAQCCSCSLPITGIQETKETHQGLGLGSEGWCFFPFS